MSLRLAIGSKAKKLLSPTSLRKRSLSAEDRVEGLDSDRKQVDFGSKEETFFDSQGWLDSDCEDDFVSVIGDLTPSRMGTPNYQININRPPQVNKTSSADTFPDTAWEPSSADAKRKLAELLQENQVEVDSKQNASTGGNEINGKPEFFEVDANSLPKLPREKTSYFTGTDSACCNDGTQIEDLKHQKEKKMKTNKCCLPSLVCSLRFKERRKQKMSPVH